MSIFSDVPIWIKACLEAAIEEAANELLEEARGQQPLPFSSAPDEPTGLVVEGSIAQVIDDPARLLSTQEKKARKHE